MKNLKEFSEKEKKAIKTEKSLIKKIISVFFSVTGLCRVFQGHRQLFRAC